MCYLILLRTRIEPTWCRHFRLPPFAKNAKDGAPRCVGDTSEIKIVGHPPLNYLN